VTFGATEEETEEESEETEETTELGRAVEGEEGREETGAEDPATVEESGLWQEEMPKRRPVIPRMYFVLPIETSSVEKVYHNPKSFPISDENS
jgi:hypothetical protein